MHHNEGSERLVVNVVFRVVALTEKEMYLVWGLGTFSHNSSSLEESLVSISDSSLLLLSGSSVRVPV